MDPNAALRDLRECIGELIQADDDGTLDDSSQVGTVIDRFMALDEWLCKGGFLPDDWRYKLESHPPVGTRVRIVKWYVKPGGYDDNVTTPPGTEGTVTFSNNLNLGVKWDNGSTLSILDVDQYEIIEGTQT